MHSPKYLFLNIVKFNTYIFLFSAQRTYRLQPPCHVTESRLCVVLLEAPEKAVPRHILAF
jgi:hypothetical protein